MLLFLNIIILTYTLLPRLILAKNLNLSASPLSGLESLTSSEVISFKEAFKPGDLVMLFQPDCSVCKAQTQELACLKSVKLLGTHGTKDRLLHELLRFKTSYPSYRISYKQLKIISPNLKMITPQFFHILVSEEGLIFKNLGFGFKKCTDLQNMLTQ